MSGYSASAQPQSADSKPDGPNWLLPIQPQLAEDKLLPPILPLTGLKRKSRYNFSSLIDRLDD